MPGAGGVIDSFFISLGFRVDQSGAKQLKRNVDDAKSSLLGLGTALKLFVTGSAIKGIADIGSSFEQNTNAIAGFLSALGLSSNFKSGLVDAADVMKRIEADAAKLPGEADDYIQVFRAGLPTLKAAMPGGSLEEMTKFTNTIAAIGSSLKIDAPQIGRDIKQMLAAGKGRAGLDVRTFTEMLSFMRELPGQANLTAESFNAMTAPQRLQLLQATFVKLQPMIDNAAGSFDAMAGAAKSMVKTLLRTATKGLFAGMKQGLDELRALFIDDKGNATELGKSFTAAGKEVSRVIVQLVSMLGGAVKWVLKNESAMKLLKGALVLVGIALGALALQQTIGFLGQMFTAVFNLKKLLLGGLLIALVLIAEDIYTFLQGGDSVIGMLLNKFPIATKAAIFALGLLGAAFVALRVKALIELGIVAAKAVTTAGIMGKGFMAALGPIGALILGIMALWEVLDLADQKFDWVNKVSNAIAAITGIERTTEPDALKAANVQSNFKRFDPNGAPAFLAKPLAKAAPMQTWTPNMGYAGGAAAGAAGPQAGPTLNFGDVTIKSDNPRDAGRAFMNTVRDAQSKVSH